MDGHVEPRSIYREAWDTYRKYPASLLVPGFVLFAVFGLPAALLHETKATGIADVLLLLGIQLLGFTSSMLYYGYCEKVAAQARGGEGVSIRKALSDTSRVLLQLTAAALTAEVLVALGLLLLIVPGVYLAARYAVVAPASAFEHGWPRRSLARSRDLVRSHYKLAFLTVVAMFALEQLASTFADDLLGSLAADHTVGRVVGDIAGDLLVGPFAGLMAAILYFRLRGEPAVDIAHVGRPRRHRLRLPARYVSLGELQDTFLISAVGMILVIRLQLFLTNYPQLGGGKLHIAHLLWGGLLMMIALAMLFTLIGRRWRQPAAVIGGAGFGFFIDEVGKFVTSDNDYFFKPSAGIIYILFICLYFAARWTRQRRQFTEEEYVASALDVVADATVRDLNEREKREALALLSRAGAHPLVAPLRELIERAPPGPEIPPSRFSRLAASARRRYERECKQRWFKRTVVGVIGTFASLQVLAVLLVAAGGIAALAGADVTVRVGSTVDQIGETASNLVAGGLAFIGLVRLRAGRRLDAYRWFDRSLLVAIFVGQVFAYINQSFIATWGFLVCVLLLVTVRFMAREERRLMHAAATTAHAPAATAAVEAS